MLSESAIRKIMENKKYFANGFYKNEFREFEGNIEMDDGQVISFEMVEEKMREEMNYFDPLYHLLEMDKGVNEDYYTNMVFFNQCNGEGYDVMGYDVNGFNKKGYNKYGYNKKGYNKKGYDDMGYDKEGYNKKGYNRMGYNRMGYNRMGYDVMGYSRWGGSYIDDEWDPDGYDVEFN